MARKKYYQGAKDRRDESLAMSKEAAKRMSRGQDSQIYENYEAPANLPQEVIHEFYPRRRYGMTDEYLNDSLQGVDRQMNDDVAGMIKHKSKSKY